MGFKVAQVMVQPGALMPDYGQMLEQAGLEVEFVKVNCNTEDEIIAAAHDADAVIGVATFQRFSRKVIQSLPKCRIIISMGIGYDNLDVKAATEHGVLAANVPDYCLEEMSDHAMALILACTRKISLINNMVKRGEWRKEPDPDMQRIVWPTMSRLRGQTLGLVGLGRVPRALLPKARGFGMKIIAYDPYVEAAAFESLGVTKVGLDQLLAESDVISLHAALTPETTDMLGAEQFKKMKSSAYLINTARGGLVDHAALYQALANRQLAGAGLDVTDPAPIPPDSPLLKLDNVIITAHSAHASIPSLKELLQRPGEEVARVLKGEWPVGLLNPQAKDKYRQRWG
ncbi:MAG: C-terminal binding protein [Chloroflexi bacterium]|nr:C-terminal binding protein [Chloroflexota bacterium]